MRIFSNRKIAVILVIEVPSTSLFKLTYVRPLLCLQALVVALC